MYHSWSANRRYRSWRLYGSTISVLRLAVDSCLLYMHMLPAVVVIVDDNEDARLMKRPLYTRVLSRSVYDDDKTDDDGDKKKALNIRCYSINSEWAVTALEICHESVYTTVSTAGTAGTSTLSGAATEAARNAFDWSKYWTVPTAGVSTLIKIRDSVTNAGAAITRNCIKGLWKSQIEGVRIHSLWLLSWASVKIMLSLISSS